MGVRKTNPDEREYHMTRVMCNFTTGLGPEISNEHAEKLVTSGTTSAISAKSM